ncbi:MAG: YchJ family protein [Chromatiales bacterium]|jgi:SEC-C motif-containing protein|nr:YchJ family protein [Chromatiales bacterium]MDX9766938.1 YchJ family protein [Ectothiorhodospiraceae bacterium]
MPVQPCPCGSGRAYSDCCGPFIDGGEPATAEQLMRSRYTAFVLGRADHLLRTWHPSTRPETLDLPPTGSIKWLGLQVRRTDSGGPLDNDGRVEFVARYKPGSGAAVRQHETSRFRREDGRWLYVDELE